MSTAGNETSGHKRSPVALIAPVSIVFLLCIIFMAMTMLSALHLCVTRKSHYFILQCCSGTSLTMDLYEPLGDTTNVVDAPNDAKKSPIRNKSKDKITDMPLRGGDDVDLETETGVRFQQKNNKNSAVVAKDKKPPKRTTAGTGTKSGAKKSNKLQIFLIIAIVVALLLFLLFLGLVIVTILHLCGVMTSIRSFMPLYC
ncbi:hypothetical protein Q1695_012492 [Nippostrongylus brasiliensis]|nr:hypothetical protein Q1695_012492 [Nippostrongylus brasiliensis]